MKMIHQAKKKKTDKNLIGSEHIKMEKNNLYLNYVNNSPKYLIKKEIN
jgi:hypothetical protein